MFGCKLRSKRLRSKSEGGVNERRPKTGVGLMVVWEKSEIQ